MSEEPTPALQTVKVLEIAVTYLNGVIDAYKGKPSAFWDAEDIKEVASHDWRYHMTQAALVVYEATTDGTVERLIQKIKH
jgi:hypothetical protein